MANEVRVVVTAQDKTKGALASTKQSLVGVATAGLAMGAVLVKAGADAVRAARESQKVHAQTVAVLKSTGSAAGISAKGVEKLATAISNKTGIDDEAIQSGENLLLTFRGIRNETGKGNDIFNQATMAITDMSVAMEQDMKTSAIQVGKALNDPIKGMTALSRIGVSFTQKQKDTVKQLEKTGHHLEAQKIILHELKKEFGGSAEAVGTWGDKAKVAFGNLQESFGKKLLPGLERVSKWFVKKGTPAIQDFIDSIDSQKINDVADSVIVLAGAMGKLVKANQKLTQGQGGGLSEAADEWASWKAKVLGYMDDVASAGARLGLVPKKYAKEIHAMRVKADKDLEAAQKKWNETQTDIHSKPIVAKLKAEKKDLDSKLANARKQLKDPNLTKERRAKLTAKIDELLRKKREAQRAIDQLHGKTVKLGAYWTGSKAIAKARAAIGHGLTASAHGGIPGVSHAAEGGPRGNQVLVGEEGPEIVDLPMGSHVNSNADSRRIAGSGGGGGGVHFHFHGPVYGDHNALKRALVNMKRAGDLDLVLR